MKDIIQINSTWGMNMNALRGILIMGTPLSARELFTKHAVMIKNGEPYTGDKRGNVGSNTMTNFKNWLEQASEFTMIDDKIMIENVNYISSISHITQKPEYKPFVETLFYDFWNEEYTQSFINTPPDKIVMSIDYSMINDYFPQMFNIFGDMYNINMASYYDKQLKEHFRNNYQLNHYKFYRYVMKCLRNAMIKNIDNAIGSISALGMDKKFIYTLNGKPLTTTQEDFIRNNYTKSIRYNDKLSGINYTHDLTGKINKQIKADFYDKAKIKTLSNGLQINEYSPICETWEIQLDRKYQPITPTLDIDFCRQKLNENARERVKKISGYDTILKYYNNGITDFVIPADLKKYFIDTMIFSEKHFLRQYLNDIDTIIGDIA